MVLNYKILPGSELKQLLSKEEREISDYDFQIKTNYAYTYILKDGRTILIANEQNDLSKGILFESKRELDECLEKDSFPIENENRSVEDIFNSQVMDIEATVNDFLKKQISKYNLDTSLRSISMILESSKKDFRKKTLRDRFYLGMLLGEYIRRTFNAKWALWKQYGTFNPYYKILIVNDNNSVVILSDWVDVFFGNKVNTCEWLIGLANIKKPSYELDKAGAINNNEISLTFRGKQVFFVNNDRRAH